MNTPGEEDNLWWVPRRLHTAKMITASSRPGSAACVVAPHRLRDPLFDPVQDAEHRCRSNLFATETFQFQQIGRDFQRDMIPIKQAAERRVPSARAVRLRQQVELEAAAVQRSDSQIEELLKAEDSLRHDRRREAAVVSKSRLLLVREHCATMQPVLRAARERTEALWKVVTDTMNEEREARQVLVERMMSLFEAERTERTVMEQKNLARAEQHERHGLIQFHAAAFMTVLHAAAALHVKEEQDRALAHIRQEWFVSFGMAQASDADANSRRLRWKALDLEEMLQRNARRAPTDDGERRKQLLAATIRPSTGGLLRRGTSRGSKILAFGDLL